VTGRRLPRAVAALLRTVARDDRTTGQATVDDLIRAVRPTDDLVGPARLHRLTAPLYLGLRDSAVAAPQVVSALRADYLAGLAAHVRGLAALHDASAALGPGDMPWAVFKGPVLAERSYRRSDLRPYLDLDVVLPPATVRTALGLLEGAGFTVLDRDWELLRQRRIGAIHLRAPSGIVVDLHHDLVFSGDKRARYAVDLAQILNRAEPMLLGAESYLTFDPTDTLLHLSLHATLSGADRLGWLMDVDQTVRHRPPDWDELVRRAHEWRLALVVHVMLDRCVTSLGTPVPRDVLPALQPRRAWRAVVRSAHRVGPVEQIGGAASLARAVARTAGGDTRSSRRMTVSGAQRALVRGMHESPRDPVPPEDPQHAGASGGDAAARAVFLDELEAP
jgi:hypothetical protein